jgi:hypothetical protein
MDMKPTNYQLKIYESSDKKIIEKNSDDLKIKRKDYFIN